MAKRFDRLGWAMSQENTTPTQRFVLLILADMANEQGECWPKHATVAERTGYGVTTVRDALRELRAVGLVEADPRQDRGGRQTSNLYRLRISSEGDGNRHPATDEGASSRQGEVPAADTSTRTSQKQPPNRQNNSMTTSRSRSRRHAARDRSSKPDGFTDPTDAVWAVEDEGVEPESITKARTGNGANTVVGLRMYYDAVVRVHGFGRAGNHHEKAIGKCIRALRQSGLEPEQIRDMIDAFAADKELFNQGDARWKTFIASVPILQRKAEERGSVAEVGSLPRGVPQHVLDRIMAETG